MEPGVGGATETGIERPVGVISRRAVVLSLLRRRRLRGPVLYFVTSRCACGVLEALSGPLVHFVTGHGVRGKAEREWSGAAAHGRFTWRVRNVLNRRGMRLRRSKHEER